MRTPSADLHFLRDKLAATASPRLKLKLLARAWRRVRDLDAEERRALATDLGMKEAEALLDRIGRSKGGRAADRILERLGLAGDDEPLDLPGILKDLTAGAGVPVATAPASDVLVPAREAVTVEPAPAPRPEPAPARPPFRPKPQVVSARQEPSPSPAPPEITADEAPAALQSIQAVPRRLFERLNSARSLIARFRILRESFAGDAPPEDAEIEEVLACFPSGWARRRALSSLLRSGHPAALEHAMALIESLELPWHRRWCASDLIMSGRLGLEEERLVRERLLARDGS